MRHSEDKFQQTQEHINLKADSEGIFNTPLHKGILNLSVVPKQIKLKNSDWKMQNSGSEGASKTTLST